MTIRSWNLILVVALLAVLSLGGWILYQNQEQKRAEMAAEQARLEQVAQEERARHMQAVEDFLNGFLHDIQKAALEYKNRRRVLVSLSQPQGMKTAEYVEQNADLAESTILALQLQMDKIMKMFNKSDEDFAALIAFLDEADRPGLEQKWQQERKAQADLFMGYFASEQDVLKAYGELMRFYEARKSVMHIDESGQNFVFDSPEDAAEAQKLQDEIKKVSAQQAEFLATGTP